MGGIYMQVSYPHIGYNKDMWIEGIYINYELRIRN